MENNSKSTLTMGSVLFKAFVQAVLLILGLWAWNYFSPKPAETAPAATVKVETPPVLLRGSYMAVLSTVDQATKVTHSEWGKMMVMPGNLLDSVTAIQSLPVWNEGGADFVGIPDDSDSGVRFISKRTLKGVEEPLSPDVKIWLVFWAPGEPH